MMSAQPQLRFVEMTGKTLSQIITEKELHSSNLESAGVRDDSIVRVNEQGDIEVRRQDRWDIIGGLLGNYSERIRHITGLDWA
jgi:hypothetical protein